MTEAQTSPLAGTTAWARNLETPLRSFLRTETGQRGAHARGDRGGARVGQRRCLVLPPGLGHDALDPDRRLRDLGEPSLLAEQRPDDVLLLRRRPRGASRVRYGRAARTAPVCTPARRWDRRHGGARADLPRDQRRPAVGARLGGGDVDGYRARSRDARAGRATVPRAAARLHAHGLRRRRRDRAGRDRHRLHTARRISRHCLRPARCWQRCSSQPG